MNSPSDSATASKAVRVLFILVFVSVLAIGRMLTHGEMEEEARWQKLRKDQRCILVYSKTERNAGYVTDTPVNQTDERWQCDDGEHMRSFISE